MAFVQATAGLPGGQRHVSFLGPLSEGPSRDLPPQNNYYQLAKTHDTQKSGVQSLYSVFNSI